jgi:ribose transport system substrate-binding protein
LRVHRAPTRVSALVAVVLALLAAACGGQDASSSEPSPASEAQPGSSAEAVAEDAGGQRVVYVGGSNIPFYEAVACGAEQMAGDLGIEFEAQYPDTFAPDEQIPILEAVIASQPDGIMLSPTEPTALRPAVDQALAAGIEVVTVANSLNDREGLASVVLGNNRQNGVLAAERIADLADDRQGKVAYIGYTPGGSLITDARQAGFEEEIAKYDNLQYLPPVVTSGLTAQDGAAAANALLTEHPDLLAIVGSFLSISTGVGTVIQEQGLEDQIISLQLDSDDRGIELLREGAFDAVVGEAVYDEGVAAMEQLSAAFAGEPTEEEVSTDPVVFTPENVDDPDLERYIVKAGC